MLNIIIGSFITLVILSILYGVGKLINKLIIKPRDKDTIHGNIFVGCFSLVMFIFLLVISYSIGKFTLNLFQ